MSLCVCVSHMCFEELVNCFCDCGCVCVCVDSHVLRGIGECGGVLRRCILRPMGGSVAHDHENGPMGVHPLRRPEVVNAVICDQVCQVVLSIERRQDA